MLQRRADCTEHEGLHSLLCEINRAGSWEPNYFLKIFSENETHRTAPSAATQEQLPPGLAAQSPPAWLWSPALLRPTFWIRWCCRMQPTHSTALQIKPVYPPQPDPPKSQNSAHFSLLHKPKFLARKPTTHNICHWTGRTNLEILSFKFKLVLQVICPPSPLTGHTAGATFHLHPFDRHFQYSNHCSSALCSHASPFLPPFSVFREHSLPFCLSGETCQSSALGSSHFPWYFWALSTATTNSVTSVLCIRRSIALSKGVIQNGTQHLVCAYHRTAPGSCWALNLPCKASFTISFLTSHFTPVLLWVIILIFFHILHSFSTRTLNIFY